jgi:hypothetical protein
LTLLAVGQTMTAESGGYQLVDGLGVYLGVMPSEMLLDRAEAGPVTTMHGGPPGGKHAHHVVVAMPMADALTYGNYFEMRTKTRYRVILDITTPRLTRPLRATFEYDHE